MCAGFGCMDGTWIIWKIALDPGLAICTRHMPAWHACILLWVNESFLFPGLPSRFLCRFFIHALLSGCNPCTLVGNTLSLQQFVLLRCHFLGSLCRLCLRFWCSFFPARCCFCDLCFFSFLSLLPTFALPIFRLLGFSLSRSLRLRLGAAFAFPARLGGGKGALGKASSSSWAESPPSSLPSSSPSSSSSAAWPLLFFSGGGRHGAASKRLMSSGTWRQYGAKLKRERQRVAYGWTCMDIYIYIYIYYNLFIDYIYIYILVFLIIYMDGNS